MYLNTISSDEGSRRKAQRVGRGMGSKGKTCGRGHKGQHSRAGGYHKVGFEGGQMPLVRRLPKFGFSSYKAKVTEEIRLDTLEKLPVDTVDIAVLKEFNLIKLSTKYVKVINSGELTKKVTLRGIRVTKSAKAIIESLGGQVEE